jgi:Raf kinase inhibitor-like YbhB/YbcL family protein
MARRDECRTRRLITAAAGLTVSLLLSGCGLLSGPHALSGDAPLIMQVISPVVTSRHILPQDYTCHGEGESPPISWSGAPAGTKSFALVIDDHDAPISPYVYWMVVNISQQTTDIQAGVVPPKARVADNSTGHARYDAPCPIGATHRYRISVYALNAQLGPAPAGGPQLLPTWTAIAPHVIARGTMTVTACPAPGTAGWEPVCKPPKSSSGT